MSWRFSLKSQLQMGCILRKCTFVPSEDKSACVSAQCAQSSFSVERNLVSLAIQNVPREDSN